LVIGLSRAQRRGVPRLAAAINTSGAGMAHDVVADNPALPTPSADRAKLRKAGPSGTALENEPLDPDIVLAAAVRSKNTIAGRDLNRALYRSDFAGKMHY